MRSQETRYARMLLGLLAIGGVLVLTAYLMRRRPAVHRGPITQALVPIQPADLDLGVPGANLDRRLDEALLETFPASDPISTHIE
jgi:hypothetical protein